MSGIGESENGNVVVITPGAEQTETTAEAAIEIARIQEEGATERTRIVEENATERLNALEENAPNNVDERLEQCQALATEAVTTAAAVAESTAASLAEMRTLLEERLPEPQRRQQKEEVEAAQERTEVQLEAPPAEKPKAAPYRWI